MAVIENPEVVRKILAHLGLPTEVPKPLPARALPGQQAIDFYPDADPAFVADA